MTLYDIPAPAKINLFLHVVGRNNDGYHLLQTAFRFIDLCDSLNFEKRSDGLIVCETRVEGVPAEGDLVLRAAQTLQRATGTSYGAQISYTKIIPTGGGLGGGSSDAASTLIALNRLWGTNLDRKELMRLGSTLGADVPVFIFGQAAFAQGIGDVLTSVDMPPRSYMVVQPAQTVSTAAVFSAPELTRDTPCVKMSVFTDGQTSNDTQTYFGRNDLEPVVRGRYPRVRRTGSWLRRQGLNARMSGSGSCFFVEFVTLAQAVRCQQEIIVKMPYLEKGKVAVIKDIWACAGLFDHPLRHWIRS